MCIHISQQERLKGLIIKSSLKIYCLCFFLNLLMRPCNPAASPNAVPAIVNPVDKPPVTGANIMPKIIRSDIQIVE